MVRVQGPLLRLAAILLFDVLKDEGINLQIGTTKGNGQP